MKIKKLVHRFSRRFYIDVYGNIHRKSLNITKNRWNMISNQQYIFSGEVFHQGHGLKNKSKSKTPGLKKELSRLANVWKKGQKAYWEVKQIKLKKYKLKNVNFNEFEKDSFQKMLFYKRFLHYYKNITIKQFKNLYKMLKTKQKNVNKFWEIVESRLDSVLVRSQLVRTMYAARHYIKYKHIVVNGQTINRMNYFIKVGDLIGLRRKKLKDAIKIKLFGYAKMGILLGVGPAYLETDFRLLLTTLISKPTKEQIRYVFSLSNCSQIYFYMWRRFSIKI